MDERECPWCHLVISVEELAEILDMGEDIVDLCPYCLQRIYIRYNADEGQFYIKKR